MLFVSCRQEVNGTGRIHHLRKAILFIAFVAVFGFLLYRAFHSGPTESPQDVTHCDPSLWKYVYNPGRLQVLNACISITGAVEKVINEADGDYHIRFRLDQQFESLLDEENISKQHGDLILELMCQGNVTQADAVNACSQYDGPYFKPEVGQRYFVWGTYVHDADHGWNELHPVTSMQPVQ